MELVKRFMVAVSAGSVAMATGLLSSAALGLPAGGGVGAAAGGEGVSACDRDGVGTTLRTAFEGGIGYAVTAVVVDGIDGRCAGHRLRVVVTDAAGRMVAQGGPLPVSAGEGRLTVPVPTMPVESVGRVHTLLD
ncbi:MAG: hypothetical protein QOE80_1566 [Actinomycetota bacterium]|jgi:hypothetical protein|nr:hypothetical protein [Actinomycetota bacterium]